jgi:hypothetical protein
MEQAHPYKKLGGFLKLYVVFSFIDFASIALLIPLNLWANFIDFYAFLTKGMYILAAFLLVSILIMTTAEIVRFVALIQLVNRRPNFLKLLIIGVSIKVVSAGLQLLVLLLGDRLQLESALAFATIADSVLFGVVLNGLLLWYFFRSVRVRTYMGNDEYLAEVPIIKVSRRPQPAIPDYVAPSIQFPPPNSQSRIWVPDTRGSFPIEAFAPPAKTKKPVSKPLIVVLSCIAAVIVLCIGLVYFAVFIPRSATDIPVSIGGIVDRQIKIQESSKFLPPVRFFDTVDEAIKDRFEQEKGNLVLLSGELFRFQDEDSVTTFYMVDNLQDERLLVAMCVDKHDGNFSNFLFAHALTLRPGDRLRPVNYQYSDADAAAHYVFDSLSAYDVYSRANSGQWTAIGISESDNVYNMTILGQSPTEIYTFYDEGVKYYVWCYVGLDMREALIGSPEGNVVSFTLGSIEEKLDIRFD